MISLVVRKLFVSLHSTSSPRFSSDQRAQGEPFSFNRIMPKVPYPKQIQTFANQIGILKQRGMTFADEAAAEAWLHRVSYYRMSGYWYPLLADRVNHTFKPGTTFEQAVSLYEFDSRLRELVFRNIGRIEVAVRTQMAYVMSMAKGGTWFADASLFTNTAQHAKTLQSIADYGGTRYAGCQEGC